MKKRPEHAVSVETRVAFQQCDPLGVVWHGRYLEWLEEARTALFRSVGLDVPEIRALGHRMYVVESLCRYMAPLAYGDRVRVTAWFGDVTPVIRVAYDVHNADTGRWSARGHTLLATTDAKGALLTATPAAVLERLPRVAGTAGGLRERRGLA